MTSSMHCCRCLLAAAVVAFTAAASSHAADAAGKNAPVVIVVEAGKTDRIDTPVSVPLGKLSVPAGDLELHERGKGQMVELPNVKAIEWRGGKMIVVPNGTIKVPFAIPIPVPCQVDPGPPRRLCWILPGRTPAGKTRTFVLRGVKGTRAKAVKVTRDDKALEISLGKAKVLRYNHAVVPPPKGVAAKYGRSGFIHPLWSPDGQVLTQIHPRDHLHHMGLWHPWTRSKFEGRRVNFWDLRGERGTVRFAKFISTASGSIFGSFTALQEHVVLKAKGQPKVALNDTFSVTAWNLNQWWALGKVPDGFLLDFVSTQRCATDSPLELQKHRYGGFGFRGNPQWNYKNSNYLTSEGKKRRDGHATRARWCIVHGRAKEGPAGVIFMSHPANHAHPEPIRIWNKRPEMFFNFCPIQKAAWTLKPGSDYVFRYRAYAFKGTVTAEDAERLWQDFANPPKATVSNMRTPPKIRTHTRHSVAPADGATPTAAERKPIVKNPFFILDNGTGQGKLSPKDQAKLLKDSGCDGMGYGSTRGVPEMLAALEAAGRKMHANYLGVNVGPKGDKYHPDLPAAIKAMAGHGTVVWLYVSGARLTNKAAGARAVKVIREVADLAAAAKLRVALYPHVGCYIERFDHALDIAEKVGRENVGVTFNLCHWLQVQGKDDIPAVLKRATRLKLLYVVTINGADVGGKGWKQLIQTLDKGTFDNTKLLKTLRDLGYRGPIGLQCYGVRGDFRENLKRSMAAWRKIDAAAGGGKKRPDVLD